MKPRHNVQVLGCTWTPVRGLTGFQMLWGVCFNITTVLQSFCLLLSDVLILTLHVVLLTISFLPRSLRGSEPLSEAFHPGSVPTAIWLWNIIWNSHAFEGDTAGAISQHSGGVLSAREGRRGGDWVGGGFFGLATSSSQREHLANHRFLVERNGSTATSVNVLIVTD